MWARVGFSRSLEEIVRWPLASSLRVLGAFEAARAGVYLMKQSDYVASGEALLLSLAIWTIACALTSAPAAATRLPLYRAGALLLVFWAMVPS